MGSGFSDFSDSPSETVTASEGSVIMRSLHLWTISVVFVSLACDGLGASRDQAAPVSFVADCSQSNGQVVMVSFTGNIVSSEVVVKGVNSFRCVPEGHCVYRDKEGNWHTGNIRLPSTISQLDVSVVPEEASYAAVSHDGDRIVWVAREGDIDRLILLHLGKKRMTTLSSVAGHVRVPSWSPDDSYVAYYYGPSDATVKDGFVLMLIRAAEGAEPIRLTRPSLWTSLSPDRTVPPQWSPDGSKILFEGREDDRRPVTCQAIVDVNSHATRKSVSGTWSKDSKHLFTTTMAGSSEIGQQARVASIDVSSTELKVDACEVSIPRNCLNLSFADDGRYAVFSTSNDGCYLVDTSTGERRTLPQCGGPCKFYWLQ